MKMALSDVTIIGANEGETLQVCAGFGGLALEWPTELTFRGITYTFAYNEFMENWMVGKYSGHAIYKVKE